MRKQLITVVKLIILIATVIIIYFIGVLLINAVKDYKPSSSPLAIMPQTYPEKTIEKNHFSILSWNIGYGGLGGEADFFYDGGRMARPQKLDYTNYFDGILKNTRFFDSLDFVLLQEVDTGSARSYYTNQYLEISDQLISLRGVFAKNYDVLYVPVPVFSPMGRVVSGISFFSAHSYTTAELVVFPLNYSWPKSLFLPDRCFLCLTYTLTSGKKLHIINTHNSAFDNGSLRNAQLVLLFNYMNTLYEDGGYVVAGGDWNINPPGFINNGFFSADSSYVVDFNTSLFEENDHWQVMFDQRYPTNRDVSAPYIPGFTPTTIIDFFVCSPNISVLETKTMYNGFLYSDHQPVYLRFALE